MTNYDQYYQTDNLFGDPCPELLTFFKQYEPKGKLIDLGCGQGRNAIPLARIGYCVMGMDKSRTGIDQLKLKSKKARLNIDARVDDIYTFNNYSDFDIVLLDSMFHFSKQDKEREIGLIKTIAKGVNKNSLICFCIQDSGKKVTILKEAIASSGVDFETLNDSSLIYRYEDKTSGHTSKSKYCLYIIKKI